MSEPTQIPVSVPPIFRVAAGEDRFGEQWNLGTTFPTLKVSAKDNNNLGVFEITVAPHAGPARHFHFEQDEWFYILEGEFIFEVGQERLEVKPGDSLYGPRKIPHVWANAGNEPGKMLFLLTPAGQMEAFFEAATKNSALPMDPAFFRTYGMELAGPPLSFD